MATVTVTAANTNTRVNDADSNTNWANLGGGGPSPASEAQLRYQYSGTGSVGAVNRKVTSTSARQGVQYDPGSGALDMTAAANRLWLAKVYVADFGDLNATWGVELRIGSSNTLYHQYNVAGTGANRAVFNSYPAAGGYLILALDPNIAAWREGTTGPSITAVDYFGVAAQFIVGGAKSENLAMDAIDVGTGIQLYGGDGGDTDGNYQSFVDFDQGTIGNRFGYVTQAAGAIFVRGMLVIGRNNTTPTATGFTTNPDTVVVYPDGYHSAGLFGTTVDLGNASTVVTISNTQIGRGSATTEDTRPDFIFTGTSGSGTLGASLTNFRNITLTSAVTMANASVQCQLLTQASADIEDSVVRTNALTQVACLQDPTFGTTTDLHDTEFEQTGAGHAIELDTATTYTFTNLFFTGYGGTPGSNLTPSSGANDAAILNSSGGAVTINISGGDIPSVRNTAGSTTTVVATVNYNMAGMNAGTEITILDRSVEILEVDGDQDLTFGTSGSQAQGQSFQVGSAVNVERIKILLRIGSGSPTDAVKVRLVDGIPGSTLLAESVPIPASDLTGSYQEFDVDLTQRVALSASTTYGFEIVRTGAMSATDYYQTWGDTTDVYGGGQRYGNNGSWVATVGDVDFILMEPASDHELFHVESSGTSETWAHDGTTREIEVLALHVNYLPIANIDNVGPQDQDATLTQSPDRVYLNP